MRLDALVELRDQPGQLSQVLGIIGRYGGNILSVQHERAKSRGGFVPVRVVLEASEDAGHAIVEALRKEMRVLSVSGEVATIPYAFLLLGHVFQAQITELTDAVFATGCEVRTVKAEISSREDPSAVLMEIAAPSHDTLQETRERLRSLAKSKGLVYVSTLEAEAIE